MIKFTQSYASLHGNAKRTKAIQDIIAYLGLDKFVDITVAIQDDAALGKMDRVKFMNIAGLSGISGYPIEAWSELLFGSMIELTPAQAMVAPSTYPRARAEMTADEQLEHIPADAVFVPATLSPDCDHAWTEHEDLPGEVCISCGGYREA